MGKSLNNMYRYTCIYIIYIIYIYIIYYILYIIYICSMYIHKSEYIYIYTYIYIHIERHRHRFINYKLVVYKISSHTYITIYI